MNSKPTRSEAVAAAASSTMYPEKLGKRKFRKTPRCIYFYYISRDNAGRIRVTHYYDTEENNDEIEPEDLQGRIINLAVNARQPENSQSPPPIGSNLHHIVWTRKSYIVFLLDLDDGTNNYEFVNEGVEITLRGGGTAYTFYDGEVSTINLPSRPGASFFRCINHMKRNSAGNDLGRTAEWFEIKLDTYPVIARSHDDGGTNMGPPVPPP